MRSLLKISLAVLAVGFLVVSGSAFAQDMAKPTMTITGNVGAAFGQFSYDKAATNLPPGATLSTANKAYSEFVTSWESNIRFTWQTDSFQVISRARIRNSIEGSGCSATNYAASCTQQSGTAFAGSGDDWYNEVWWTPGAFKLGIGKFQGQAWSQPFSGEYIIINPIDVAGGASEYWMNWTGISGLDAEYNLGMIQVGLAVSSQCKPSCGPGATNASIASHFLENAQTLVPHLTGSSGPISFRVQLPMAQADYTTCISTGCDRSAAFAAGGSPKTLTGSGLQAGVGFSQSGLYVAADYSTFQDDNSASLYEASGTTAFGLIKARNRTSESIRVDIPAGPGSINLGYFTQDDNQPVAAVGGSPTNSGLGGATAQAVPSSHTYTNTIMTVRYNIPVSFGTITPEYRAATFGGGQVNAQGVWLNGDTNKDLSDSEFRVIFNGVF